MIIGKSAKIIIAVFVDNDVKKFLSILTGIGRIKRGICVSGDIEYVIKASCKENRQIREHEQIIAKTNRDGQTVILHLLFIIHG